MVPPSVLIVNRQPDYREDPNKLCYHTALLRIQDVRFWSEKQINRIIIFFCFYPTSIPPSVLIGAGGKPSTFLTAGGL
eukprot:8039724-Pyramimonas_sp.AAC.1